MKRILVAAAALAISATAAYADAFANYYDNTVNITYPDGSTVKAFVNKDKTWERHNGDGKVVKGTFEEKEDGTVCFTQTDPAPEPDTAPACLKIDDHKPGDSWSTKDDKGNETKYSMTAGR